MARGRSPIVAIADTVSDLLYGISGWLLIGLGIVFGLAAPVALAHGVRLGTVAGSTILLCLAVLFVLGGLMVNPRFGGRIDERRSITAVGSVRSVDHRTIYPEADCTADCLSCDRPITNGLERRYRNQFVVGGVPIWLLEKGHNHYCTDCALRDVFGTDIDKETRQSVGDDAQLSIGDVDAAGDTLAETDQTPIDEYE